MDEKVKEIKERLQHPIFLKDPERHLQIEQARDDIKYLLSNISTLEAKVKELEKENKTYFPHTSGARMRYAELEKRMKELNFTLELFQTEHAKAVHESLYQGTRHSSATEATDRVGVDAVQEFLDHTSRKMTQRYIQKNTERLRKVLRK